MSTIPASATSAASVNSSADRPDLPALLAAAFAARGPLIQQLQDESTNAFRLFHGTAEGWPGLTIDRYGDVLLVQTFHQSLADAELAAIRAFYTERLPGLQTIYNDRSARSSRIANRLPADELTLAETPREISELGVTYRFYARHAGQDPTLFLDLRAARRRVALEAPGRSVLNLFAYTCGVGTVAAKAGAQFVVNVDFAESALAIGKDNARLNELPVRPRFIKSDVFAATRQLSGVGQPEVVRGKRMPAFPRIEARQFDLVFLDPPRYAKSLFGVVDLVNDYAAVFKLALLCTKEGGTLICTNNVAQVPYEQWIAQLGRSAAKAGRTIREIERILPESDFPSFDDQPPLKIALLRI